MWARFSAYLPNVSGLCDRCLPYRCVYSCIHTTHARSSTEGRLGRSTDIHEDV
ncbi:hypothetical protein B0T12DRAFT_411521 [Alternaria alternata]|nr:hypothetical protein B0T12DRAFT_411521 [Alternaria alternata]